MKDSLTMPNCRYIPGSAEAMTIEIAIKIKRNILNLINILKNVGE